MLKNTIQPDLEIAFEALKNGTGEECLVAGVGTGELAVDMNSPPSEERIIQLTR